MSGLSADQAVARERTLRAALLLSLWGPLATGLAVAMSRSATQLADFIRRSVELLALAASWWVFRRLERSGAPDPDTRRRLERLAGLAVAAALGCSGLAILAVAALRLSAPPPEGNVYPGLAIAALGLLTNAWFWRRYARMTREHYNPIIAAQTGLYRAKALVDLCVLGALLAVAISPAHPATRIVDLLGSAAVALYLIWSAVRGARLARAGTPESAGARRRAALGCR